MINYTFSSKPVKNFEGRTFHSILENDVRIVGYSEIIREIPPIMCFSGDAIVFKEVILTKGEIFGGIIRAGEISGAKISGGEINGGNLAGGQFIGGTWNYGVLLNGIIRGGEFNGPTIYNGEFWGGIFNKVTIYDGVWNGGTYDETPLQIQTKEMFCFVQFPHGSTPHVLSMGCETAFLDDFDVLDIQQRHGFSDEMYNEYLLYENIYKQKYRE